ncbi:hypothetical protein [Pseudolysinimonas yzui]|uniref:ATP synthase protein I n=1 Tax=Pseudolysinimonas yzui TaxID=2708254 RepID=A0A8J3GNE6_9MICO|nr:hypothetical protein [Pseudolysinimonas yzui]GHF07139.1 hypothetical protein GCM10011600_04720 [Pseudolysinimonas yzui]
MTVAALMTRALRYGAIVAVAVAVVAGTIGWLTSGLPGLLGGLSGAALSAVFLGLTAVSILIAGRVTRGDPGNPAFFGIVLGVWVLKLVAFVVAAIFMRAWDAVDPVVFFWAVIAAVIGTLVGDIVALVRTRIPYASDVVLPGDPPRA